MRNLRFLLKTHYAESRALVIGINAYQNAGRADGRQHVHLRIETESLDATA